MTDRVHGELVKWVDEGGKRFGFLRASEAGVDVYVGGAEMDRAGVDGPQVGDRFSFDVMQDRRGDRAADVRREGGTAPAAEQVFRHEPVRP
jgi:cold shock CspA family protein